MKNHIILRKLSLLLAIVTLMTTLTIPAAALSSNVHDILFDADYYYAANPDVARAFGRNASALRRHYEQYGKREGRAPSELFDPKVYVGLYPDLKAAFGTNYTAAYNHFCSAGIAEGRQASAKFSLSIYKANYADLRNAFGNNNLLYLKHWREFGKKEHRSATQRVSAPAAPSAPSNNPSGGLRSPVPKGVFFNKRTNDNGFTCYHDINVNVSTSTPVYAIADGTVSFRQAYTPVNGVNYLTSYGNHIVFTSADGTWTAKYCHLNSFNSVGQKIPTSQSLQRSGNKGRHDLGTRQVKAGDVLGYIGKSGNASGLHLHFELYKNGKRVDPTTYISGLTR